MTGVQTCALPISEQQVPRVSLRGRQVAVVWTSRHDGTTEIRVAQSVDQGATFSPSRRISADGARGTRGWASVVVGEDDRIHVAWLDTRVAATQAASSTTPTASASGAHVMGAGTHVMSSGTRQDLYEAVIDTDGTMTEHLVATNVCFCCKTSITQGANSTWIAYRDIYGDNYRDMSVARIRRDDVERTRVSDDGWQINGCPEDGPALAVGAHSLDIV